METVFKVKGKKCPGQPCPLRHQHDHQQGKQRAGDHDGAAETQERVRLRDKLATLFAAGKRDHVLRIFMGFAPLEAAYMSHLLDVRLSQDEYVGKHLNSDFTQWLSEQVYAED